MALFELWKVHKLGDAQARVIHVLVLLPRPFLDIIEECNFAMVAVSETPILPGTETLRCVMKYLGLIGAMLCFSDLNSKQTMQGSCTATTQTTCSPLG